MYAAFQGLENIANGQPPPVIGGVPAVSSLTGCGGPLGSCGTLGSDPWSEGTGLGDVRDPERFIMDYNGVTFSDVSDFIAGAGDSLTFGLTAVVRKKLGPDWDAVNYCGSSVSRRRVDGNWSGNWSYARIWSIEECS